MASMLGAIQQGTDPVEEARKSFYQAMEDEKKKQAMANQLTRKPVIQGNPPANQPIAWTDFELKADDSNDEMEREREELRRKVAAIDRMCNPKPPSPDRPTKTWLKVLPCKRGLLEHCNVCGHRAEPLSAVQNVTNELHYTVRCSNTSCRFYEFHARPKYLKKEDAFSHWNQIMGVGYICGQCGEPADYTKQLCKKCASQTPF